MIIIMNILISLVGLGGIIIARNMVYQGTEMRIKSHLIVLLLKLIVSSMIIGLFLINTKRDFWSIFILSGMSNIVVLHFIEAFITQKKLLHKWRINV